MTSEEVNNNYLRSLKDLTKRIEALEDDEWIDMGVNWMVVEAVGDSIIHINKAIDWQEIDMRRSHAE